MSTLVLTPPTRTKEIAPEAALAALRLKQLWQAQQKRREHLAKKDTSYFRELAHARRVRHGSDLCDHSITKTGEDLRETQEYYLELRDLCAANTMSRLCGLTD